MTVPPRFATALADRYRIERELGAGGMATVYLAHDLKHDRDVAIKVLHPDLAAALGGVRFLSEIKTTAKRQHPHILPLLDSGSADGLLYYVMPYMTGETLRSRLEREQQLPIEDALRIAVTRTPRTRGARDRVDCRARARRIRMAASRVPATDLETAGRPVEAYDTRSPRTGDRAHRLAVGDRT